MFPLQIVLLKIIFHSNIPLYPCFPRKWYALKSFLLQMAHFIYVSLANGTPLICFPIKWLTLSILPLQIDTP